MSSHIHSYDHCKASYDTLKTIPATACNCLLPQAWESLKEALKEWRLAFLRPPKSPTEEANTQRTKHLLQKEVSIMIQFIVSYKYWSYPGGVKGESSEKSYARYLCRKNKFYTL